VSSEIQQSLRSEYKEAMRARDQRRVDVIRQVETEIATATSAPGFAGEVDDELYLKVIASYCKKMDKARKEYAELGQRGAEMAEKLAFEVEYLSRWLPQKLDEAATRELVQQTIAELGVSGPKMVGRVVGQIMKAHKGEVDGGLVNRLVREALGD
jgi:uncharacterized protein YqeY